MSSEYTLEDKAYFTSIIGKHIHKIGEHLDLESLNFYTNGDCFFAEGKGDISKKTYGVKFSRDEETGEFNPVCFLKETDDILDA